MKNKIYTFIIILIFIFTIIVYLDSEIIYNNSLSELYVKSVSENNTNKNIVTSIYLDYRLFDTIFEALLLLISVIAVFQFTNLKEDEMNFSIKKFKYQDDNDFLLSKYILSFLYPLFVILGIYIIYNGADSPGGGFQGGAILATLLISRYLVNNQLQLNVSKPYKSEKLIYIIILLISALFLTRNIDDQYTRIYLLSMNILIGLKVAMGFISLFLKFIRGDI
ncbi:MAG: MnhB domain-containing protein [Tissierellia bacterium]|nr:MnhB domain-containing protein [Tissierellia bacterium]